MCNNFAPKQIQLLELLNTKVCKKSQNLAKLPLVYNISKKHTLLHKFCMKNNLKYIRSSLKSYPFRPVLHEFDTLSRYARTVFNYEKSPFLREFLDVPDTPLDIWAHPPEKNMYLILDKFDA